MDSKGSFLEGDIKVILEVRSSSWPHRPSPAPSTKKHLEDMARGGRTCDAAFLLLSEQGENTEYIHQVIEVLKPKVVFLHMALQTPDETTIETFQEKYPSVKFIIARDPGERFHYKAN